MDSIVNADEIFSESVFCLPPAILHSEFAGRRFDRRMAVLIHVELPHFSDSAASAMCLTDDNAIKSTRTENRFTSQIHFACVLMLIEV
jgi:hypothetical protein